MIKKEDALKSELKQSPPNRSVSNIYEHLGQHAQYSISQRPAFSISPNERGKLNGMDTCFGLGTTIFRGRCKK
jgi:hypothetical protein